MKYRVVELLKDPADGTPLKVAHATVRRAEFHHTLTAVKCQTFCALKNRPVTPSSVTVEDCVGCYSQEVTDGELVSASGNKYPIVKGIPRLLSKETAAWVRKNQDTFSLEWKNFKFGERNWGQDIEFRKGLFLRGMGVDPAELRGKRIFDAGCGSGLLSMTLADSYGMEVVALDLAFGIEQAYVHNKNPFVYFIQGSVLEPPVKPKTVDFIYCAGVLVHVDDAKKGFKALLPALKAGARYFIWVYHPIDARHHPKDKFKMSIYNWLRINLVSRLPIRIQHSLFMALLPPYIVKRELGKVFGSKTNAVTWREKLQDLTDMFSPVYQHRFTTEAILEWYHDAGLVNAQIGYTEKYGFSARGDCPAEIVANNNNREAATQFSVAVASNGVTR